MTDARKLALEANKRLATALGWTNIVDVGGALLGKPTWVCDNSRDQVPVPNWAGDWKDCGPLGAKHEIDIFHNHGSVSGRWSATEYHREPIHTWPDGNDNRDLVTRLAIVSAVIAKLEAGQ